ncbi:MAG TPA: NAD-dependent malic enzyme [Myxococcales bacterium]|nr:NAD-dependent malic enzyme [Myxococcales bacterium]
MATLTQPRGFTLLHDPVLNRGTAFTDAERERYGLRGLLPPRVNTIEEQLVRVRHNLARQPDDLQKYVFLAGLHDRNETLFFRLLMDSPEELMPLVYTPTVGRACQQYGQIFQRPRGLFVTAEDKGRMAQVLRNWPVREVGVMVVTDGERILGLGDLGANGMGIPVGKLSLYTACAGVAPSRTLPVMLDVGTDNEELLRDPLYLGLRQKRPRGAEFDALVDEFVAAANEVFPGVLIQFEDFANVNAFRLLHRFRDRVCCFNDDIQGTASVVLAGIYSALRITGEKLRDQVILCLGAGEAATGICDLISSAMAAEGMSEAEARRRCWLVDSRGLVVASRHGLAAHKLPYAHAHEQLTFMEAIRDLRPGVLIGAAGQGGTFTREVLSTLAAQRERPVVFSLSNPTSQSECTAEDAYAWTEGRAIFASGSPFPPVTHGGRVFVPGQANNSYIFPGVGLGALVSGARRMTDEMFYAAARRLASLVTDEDLAAGRIYPSLSRIQEVSAHIAAAVAEVAYAHELAGKPRPHDLLAHVKGSMYRPVYD